MIHAILLAYFALAFYEKRKGNRLAIVLFGSVSALHGLFFGELDGLPYYGSAALASVVSASLLYVFCPASRLSKALIFLCVLSVIFNTCGFVLWVTYREPALYNAAMLLLYGLALLVMFSADNKNERRRTHSGGGFGVRNHSFSSGQNFHSRHKAKK